jgi:hypothetical protein
MKPTLRSVIATGMLLVSASTHAAPEFVPYSALVHNIANVNGRAVLTLRDGLWRASNIQLPGVKQKRAVYIRTSVGETAVVDFDYARGTLNSAAIEFRPAVHFETGELSVGVTSMSVDDTGHITIVKSKEDNPKHAIRAVEMQTILRALTFNTSPEALFKAVPFLNLTSMENCANEQSCTISSGPFVTEVNFQASATTPALQVSLVPDALLVLNSSNLLKFNGIASLKCSHLHYSNDDLSAEADVANISGTLQAPSRISSRDIDLQITGTSAFHVDDLTYIRKPDGSTRVSGQIATLSANLNGLSEIKLSDQNSISLNANTTVSLVRVGVILEGATQEVSVAATSSVSSSLRSAVLNFGSGNYVQLGSGSLDIQLQGDWDSSAIGPRVYAKLSNLNARVTAGAVALNQESKLRIADAHVTANSLTLKPGSKFLSGRIDAFSGTLAGGSVFSVGDKIQVKLTSGTTLAMDGNDPFVFDGMSAFPTGGINMSGGFEAFRQGTNFGVTDGSIGITASRETSGTIKGSLNNLNGHVVYRGAFDLDPSVTLTGLGYSFDGHQFRTTRDGLFGITIPTGVKFSIITPEQMNDPNHAAQAIYPVNLDLSLTQPTAFQNVAVTIDETGLHVNGDRPLTAQLAVNIHVPNGRGEHEVRKDSNSADGTHGPEDRLKRAQEFYQDDFLGCTAHLYLLPQDVGATADLSLATSHANGANTLAVLLNNTTLSSDIAIERDGCGYDVVFSALGALVGSVLAGDPLVGAAVGHIGSGTINGRIDGLIESKLQSRINSLSIPYTVVLPQI